jgi:hypothetical protein
MGWPRKLPLTPLWLMALLYLSYFRMILRRDEDLVGDRIDVTCLEAMNTFGDVQGKVLWKLM